MSDFNRDRKSGGFGGSSKFKGRDEGRGGADRGRGGFGGRRDEGGRNFGAARSFERPTLFKAVCSECGKNCEVPFKPSGLKPVFCSNCFSEQQGRGSRDFSSDKSFEKKMFTAVCESCGESCEVPFKPSEGKSVFCSNCFRGIDSASKNKNVLDGEKYQKQFDQLNSKLDEILRALKPTTVQEKIKEVKAVKEINVESIKIEPKVKKVADVKAKTVKEKVVKKITKKKV
jgi:CxxC-x17-CxxC domain-containing protein